MKQAVDRKIKEPSSRDKTFHREGEYWTVAYQGRVVRMKDSAGLHYLAYLLRYPHRPIHVLELVASADGSSQSNGERKNFTNQEGLNIRFGFGDAGEFLDYKAKAEYKERLEDLRAELEDAQACNDLGRIAKVQEEIEILNQELLRALRLGGKDRRAASPAERARINVQGAIKATLDKTSELHPALGSYLASTINTGTYCSYTPDIRLPSSWRF